MTSPAPRPSRRSGDSKSLERLGIVRFSNVAPLHWQLEPWDGASFVPGVPTELNTRLLAGDIDLTLISSIEFLRHRRRLRALPDFSIATLGPVYSVMLFHTVPWEELDGVRIALSTDSATSVELLRILLEADGMTADFVPLEPDLEAMLADCQGALLIGDAALVEGVARRKVHGRRPEVTDLGEAWYRLTRLPFTFAVWASLDDRPPSELLVARLRQARQNGLGHLADVARVEAARLGLTEAVLLRYLANFRYHLELPDRDGLLAFARRVLPEVDPSELRFWPR